ncbi:MAG: prepilin-type N-terminal cleavage/methylation domain-containing protein [Deltaproteobacteria bacterium]|nr:prepilin-type N-terminal cleavage/methylation domain-containing protein [Deltaproteobacteria bacterium]
MRASRRSSAGFTLLEVMAAVAILALTLVVLLNIITSNVRATTHSHMITTATFLARGKMVSLEDKIIEKGFQDLNEEENGTFEEDGFPSFSWESIVEKIELPSEVASKVQQSAGKASQKADPMQALTGMIGGMMGMFIEPIRVGLEESVRRVTLRVFWNERGRPEQSVDLIMYATDPAKLDLALSLGAIGAGAGAMPGGTPGQTGTPTPTSPPGAQPAVRK